MSDNIGQKEIEWTDEKVARLWNYYSRNHSYQIQYFSNHSGAFILDTIKKYVTFQGEILDFGCGPGFLISHLIKIIQTGTIFGLDFSIESVEIANKRFKGNPYFGGVIQALSLPSNFSSETMDIIISVEVIEHLDNEQLHAMLAESYRLLKPNGKLILTTPNLEDLEASKTICPECGYIFHRWQHIRSWSCNDITAVLKENKFLPIVVKPTFFQSGKNILIQKYINRLKSFIGKPIKIIQPHLFAIAEKIA